jgi:hypothetical protein
MAGPPVGRLPPAVGRERRQPKLVDALTGATADAGSIPAASTFGHCANRGRDDAIRGFHVGATVDLELADETSEEAPSGVWFRIGYEVIDWSRNGRRFEIDSTTQRELICAAYVSAHRRGVAASVDSAASQC